MNELKRLVKLVAEKSAKGLPIINQQDETSLEGRFFHGIKDGLISSDQEAMAYLYEESKINATYRMLKHRLRKKVLNSVFFLEDKNLNISRICYKEINECQFLLHQAQKLSFFSGFSLAEKSVDQALAIASDAGLVTYCITALEIKRDIHVLRSEKRKLDIANAELGKLYVSQEYLRKAEMLYSITKVELSRAANARNKFLPKLPAVIAELNDLWEQSQLSQVFNYYHQINIAWLEFESDYFGIFNAIEAAENLVQHGKLNPKWYNYKFNNFIKVYAFIRLEKYEAGLQFAEKHFQEYDPHTSAWFAYMENYVQLTLHTKQYVHTMKLMKQVLQNDFLPSLNIAAKERLELYRRFILLVSDQKTIKETAFMQQEIAELKMLSTDKEGYNLPILILHFVESLADMAEEELEAHTDRITKYIYTYLKGDKVERVRTFLRLLLLVAKEGGNYERVQAKGKFLLKKLSAAKTNKDILAELEIVPYEHLWEVVLRMLQRRRLNFYTSFKADGR